MKRGATRTACLLAVLLIIQGAQADAPGTPAAEGTASAEGITWFVPDSAQAGRIVHAGVAVLAGDGFATRTHQDLTVWVTLDDELLLFTENIHEHHGLHVLAVTPDKAGTLRFWADDGSGGHHDHLRANTPTQAPGTDPAPGAHGIMAEVPVLPGPDPETLARVSAAHEAGVHCTILVLGPCTLPRWDFEGGLDEDSMPYAALYTVTGGDGRLIASTWQAAEAGSRLIVPVVDPVLDLIALYQPYPDKEPAFFAFEERERLEDDGGAPPAASGLDLPLGAGLLPSCSETPGRLVLDPNSVLLVDTLLAWQEHSDVRVHFLHQERVGGASSDPVRYTLHGWPTQTQAGLVMETTHPLGYATFRAPAPGQYMLVVETDNGAGYETHCAARFQVLPHTEGMQAGSLALDVDQADDHVLFTMSARGPDGNALSHYEFDVHVVRLGDEHPASLFWRGKLHAHQGEVSAVLANLPPGEYEVRVHPSPQDAGIPPLDGSDGGFMRNFTVHPDAAGAQEDPPVQESPWGFVAFVVALTAAVLVLGRTRRGG